MCDTTSNDDDGFVVRYASMMHCHDSKSCDEPAAFFFYLIFDGEFERDLYEDDIDMTFARTSTVVNMFTPAGWSIEDSTSSAVGWPLREMKWPEGAIVADMRGERLQKSPFFEIRNKASGKESNRHAEILERVQANKELILQTTSLLQDILARIGGRDDEQKKLAWFEIVRRVKPGQYEVKWNDDFRHLDAKNYMASRYAVVGPDSLNAWRTSPNPLFTRVNIDRCWHAIEFFWEEENRKRAASPRGVVDASQPQAAKNAE